MKKNIHTSKTMGRMESSLAKNWFKYLLILAFCWATANLAKAQTLPITDHKCSTTTDDDKNWSMSRSYDVNGNVIGASIQYSDYRGRALQSQTYDPISDEVFATQPIYDEYGRAVIKTLPAPVNSSSLCYKDGFITVGDEDYNSTNFDGTKLDNPDAVDNTDQGTLGWWYSGNNTDEAYQAATSFPYYRTEYSSRTNQPRRSAVPGDELRMGQGHESQSYIMPAAGELYYVFGYGHGWALNSSGNTQTTPGYQVFKTISVDPEGNESVTFTDRDDKVVATALSGAVDGVNQRTMYVTSVIGEKGYVDIHLADGCEESLTLFNPYDNIKYQIIDLSNDEVLMFGENDYYTGTRPDLDAGFYRIKEIGQSISVSMLPFFPSDIATFSLNASLEVSYEVNYYEFALNYFDKAGRVIKTIPPLGIATAYSPNPTTINGNTVNKTLYEYNDQLSFSSNSNEDYTTFSLNTQNSSDEYKEISIEFRSLTIPDNNIYSQSEILDAALSGNTGEISTASDGLFYTHAMPEYQVASTSNTYLRAQLGAAFPFSTPRGKKYTGRLPGPATYQACLQMAEVYEIEYDVYSSDQYTNNFGTPDVAGSRRLWIMKKYNASTCQVETIELNGDKFTVSNTLINNGVDELQIVMTNVKKIKVNNLGGESTVAMQDVDFNFLDNYKLYFKETTFASGLPAHNMETTYTYNSLGWTLDVESPDEGKTEFTYSTDGKLRFSQNAQQKIEGKFTYTNYDHLGRAIESGVYVTPVSGGITFQNYATASTSSGSNSILDNVYSASNSLADGLDDADCEEQVFSLYDATDPNFATEVGSTLAALYTQSFTRGGVTKVWDDHSTIWYGYDAYGRQIWTIQKLSDLANYVTMDYEYDDLGNIVTVSFQKHEETERLDHHFTYDLVGRLTDVHTSLEGEYKVPQATYAYSKMGELKRTEIADRLQGVDYVYTLNGMLKSVNHPTMLDEYDPGHDGDGDGDNPLFQPDIFGMSLDYYQDDYKRAGTFINAEAGTNSSYLGNIVNQRWNKRQNVTQGFTVQNSYKYQYDHQSRLTQAEFGTYTHGTCVNIEDEVVCSNGVNADFTADALDNYKVWGLSYDANSNLLSLNRNGYGSANQATMDNFTYNYPSTSGARTNNQLTYVSDAGDNNDGGRYNDLTTQSTGNYVYNSIGQMTDNQQEDSHITYNERGLVSVIYGEFGTGQQYKKVEYIYNALGYRSQKIDYAQVSGAGNTAQKKTWYLRDSKGAILAIYEQDLSTPEQETELIEQSIYGNSRIGAYHPEEDAHGYRGFTYEFTDHLGNVRSTYAQQPSTDVYSDFTTGSLDGWIERPNTVTTFTSDGVRIDTDLTGGIRKIISGLAGGGNYTVSVNLTDVNALGVRVNVTDLTTGSTVLMKEMTEEGFNQFTVENPNSGTTQFSVFVFIPGSHDAIGSSFTIKDINIIQDELVVTNERDYYPFGMEMPGRTYTSNGGYRYAFQGQERDGEAGAEHEFFELRTWDGRIGRWTSPDPYGQFFSPYNGMGNNPINGVDPDGGFFGAITLGSALVGGIVGGVTAWASGADTKEIWASVASGAVSGAMVGLAVETGGLSVYAMAGASALGGAAGEVAFQGVMEGEIYDWGNVGWAGAFGGATAGLAPVLGRATNRAFGWFKKTFGGRPVVDIEPVDMRFIDDGMRKSVNVAQKDLILTTSEKNALQTATGYSRSRIVNGVAIIDQFGMYNETSHTQIKLIMNAFRRNGATSIKIFTNSVNDEMKSILVPRMKSGKGLFGLSIKKRIGPGYVLEGQL